MGNIHISKFAPVCPVHLYADLKETSPIAFGDYFLLLAHDVVVKPDEYRDVFGDVDATIIMDNSVIELGTAVSADMLFHACKIVNADVLAIPDVLEDGLATFEIGKKFINETKENDSMPDIEFMYIPQGKDLDDYIASVREMHNWGYTPDWIGIARNVTDRIFASREEAIKIVREYWPHARIHLLGFSSNVQDDMRVACFEDVEGIDSAVPLRIDGAMAYPPRDPGPRGNWWETAEMSMQTILNVKQMRSFLGEFKV